MASARPIGFLRRIETFLDATEAAIVGAIDAPWQPLEARPRHRALFRINWIWMGITAIADARINELVFDVSEQERVLKSVQKNMAEWLF